MSAAASARKQRLAKVLANQPELAGTLELVWRQALIGWAPADDLRRGLRLRLCAGMTDAPR